MSELQQPGGEDGLHDAHVIDEDVDDQDEAADGRTSVADPMHRQERGNRGPDDQPGFGQGA